MPHLRWSNTAKVANEQEKGAKKIITDNLFSSFLDQMPRNIAILWSAKNNRWSLGGKDPIEYSRRPASVDLIVIQLKLFFVPMHRASGSRRSSFCKPRPWRPVHQDDSQPKIPDQCRGQVITRTPRGKGRGCSSLPLIVSLPWWMRRAWVYLLFMNELKLETSVVLGFVIPKIQLCCFTCRFLEVGLGTCQSWVDNQKWPTLNL